MNKLRHDTYEIRTELDSLADLTTTLRDVIRGYDELVDRVDPSLAPKVQALRDRHKEDAAELLLLLGSKGGAPENTGSAMGALHEAVVTARDWFGALDNGALDAILDGEERVLDQYAATLSETFDAPEIHDLVAAQQQALEALVSSLGSAEG